MKTAPGNGDELLLFTRTLVIRVKAAENLAEVFDRILEVITLYDQNILFLHHIELLRMVGL